MRRQPCGNSAWGELEAGNGLSSLRKEHGVIQPTVATEQEEECMFSLVKDLGIRDAVAGYDDRQAGADLTALRHPPRDFAAFFTARPFPSLSRASRTCLNSSNEALSVRGNRKFSVSSVLTIAEPITTRANH